MFSLFKLSERRNEQLKREMKQNKMFESAIYKCSEDIVRFFIYKREMNASNVERISKESFLKQYKLLEDNMEVLDKELENFENFVNLGGDVCVFIQNYLGSK